MLVLEDLDRCTKSYSWLSGDQMSKAIQVQVNDQGDIVIPAEIRKRLGLMQGMTLVAEDGEEGQLHLRVQQESPTVVDKQGILVVTSPPSHDLSDIVRRERERRLSSLWQNPDR
jgi:AbrB family looped-hinge helix DNA binding protein